MILQDEHPQILERLAPNIHTTEPRSKNKLQNKSQFEAMLLTFPGSSSPRDPMAKFSLFATKKFAAKHSRCHVGAFKIVVPRSWVLI
jgi:hypothetical protein